MLNDEQNIKMDDADNTAFRIDMVEKCSNTVLSDQFAKIMVASLFSAIDGIWLTSLIFTWGKSAIYSIVAGLGFIVFLIITYLKICEVLVPTLAFKYMIVKMLHNDYNYLKNKKETVDESGN